MTRLLKFRGKLMVHKHRGKRWTVRTIQDIDDEVFLWLEENFGAEDFENGPWARITEQWFEKPALYDITDQQIVTMMMLRWG